MTASDPFEPVTIGIREIYDAVVSLRESVQRLEAIVSVVDDHERRIRVIEGRLWPLPTVSVLIALVALVVGIIQRGGS